jgi:hypothetical protein
MKGKTTTFDSLDVLGRIDKVEKGVVTSVPHPKGENFLDENSDVKVGDGKELKTPLSKVYDETGALRFGPAFCNPGD